MAKKEFKTPTITGYFDVKEFALSKPREQWAIKSEGAQITFSYSTDTAPTWNPTAKQYTNKEGKVKYQTRIKIGSKCVWYNESKQIVPKPLNSELNGKQYEVMIIGNDLGVASEPMKASGLWAQAIMFKERQRNFFDEVEGFGSEEPNVVSEPTQAQAQAQAQASEQVKKYTDTLPF